MPVLYGVFLYMGVSSLRGMQLVDRVFIWFMPAKYQPDLMYLRHVRTKRVHMFTAIQVICLVCLWAIKSFKAISIAFPVMVRQKGCVCILCVCVSVVVFWAIKSYKAISIAFRVMVRQKGCVCMCLWS